MSWFRLKSYSGKKVLITGGSTGIGFALAKELLLRGAQVTLVARTRTRIDSAVADLKAVALKNNLDPLHVKGFAADVCDAAQVRVRLAFFRPHCMRRYLHASCSLADSMLLTCNVFFQIKVALEYAGAVDVLICSAGAASPGEHHIIHHAGFIVGTDFVLLWERSRAFMSFHFLPSCGDREPLQLGMLQPCKI